MSLLVLARSASAAAQISSTSGPRAANSRTIWCGSSLCPPAVRSSRLFRLLLLSEGEPRSSPSPLGGEGWGEGKTAVVGIELVVTPSPGGLRPPTSPQRGEVKGGGGRTAPGTQTSSRANPSASISSRTGDTSERSSQRSGARAYCG